MLEKFTGTRVRGSFSQQLVSEEPSLLLPWEGIGKVHMNLSEELLKNNTRSMATRFE